MCHVADNSRIVQTHKYGVQWNPCNAAHPSDYCGVCNLARNFVRRMGLVNYQDI